MLGIYLSIIGFYLSESCLYLSVLRFYLSVLGFYLSVVGFQLSVLGFQVLSYDVNSWTSSLVFGVKESQGDINVTMMCFSLCMTTYNTEIKGK